MSDTNLVSAIENLKKQVDEQRQTIDKLTKENKSLRSKLDNYEKPKDAGGVETGPSRAGAAAALMAAMNKKKPPAGGGGGGGVSTGPSRAGAAAALMASLNKQKTGASGGGSGGGGSGASAGDSGGAGGMDQIFKRYEKMMKLGISIHSALTRMIQNAETPEAIEAFKKKHADKLGGVSDEKHDLKELGLVEKPKIKFSSKNIKMKRLHWDPVNPTRVPNSIWEDLDESTIKYDFKKFELNFQVRERKQVVNDSAKMQHANSNEKRFFVPKKRAQQVMIGIRGLGLNNKQLREVLHNMDEKVMTLEKLQQLMDIVPTEDEQTQAEKEVVACKGNFKLFGEAEQFFFNLCDFYHLAQRLRLWAFKMQFHELQANLLDQFKQVQKTCDKVRNNRSLKQLLTIVLAFGNHMNSGTRKGQAFGFDLKILGSLQNIKTHDNSRSLLMYLYEFCDSKYPKVLSVLTELKPILKVSHSTETDVLNSLYEKIKENMKELKDIIESDDIDESYDMDDSFVKVMAQFYKKSQPQMKKFHMTVGNVLVSTKRLMKKFTFGEEENPEPVERLFAILYQFLLDLENSKLKLIKLEKERAKKRKDRLKNKKRAEKARSNKFTNSVKTRKSGKLGQDLGSKDESKEDAWDWDKYKGGTLKQALNTTLAFEEELDKAKSTLSGHIKNKASFVAAEGDLSKLSFVDQRRTSTMRRVSSMYQADQEEAKKLADARRKQRILNYNKGALPPAIGINAPTSNSLAKFAGSIGNTPNSNFERERRGTPAFPVPYGMSSPLPDDKVIAAPKKFDRASGRIPLQNSHSGHSQTTPMHASVKLNNSNDGTTPPSKPLPKGIKDKRLPPNKELPNRNNIGNPPQTGSVPNLYQSQNSPTNGHNANAQASPTTTAITSQPKPKKKHHHKKNKHKGPSSPAASQPQASTQVQMKGGYQGNFSQAQQQWMAQNQAQQGGQNYQSQPNLYNNNYGAQVQAQQPQQPQGQWTKDQVYNYYYQQVAAQPWTQEQKQQWAMNQAQRLGY